MAGSKSIQEAKLELELAKIRNERDQLAAVSLIRRQRRIIAKNFLIAYVFIVIIAIIGVALSLTVYKNDDLPTPFDVYDSSSAKQSDVEDLKNEVERLKKSLAQPSSGDKDIQLLSGQIEGIESKISDLSETILESPDKALTARLLREKQTTIDESMKDLKSDVNTLQTTFVGLIVTGLIVPLLVGVVSFGVDTFKNRKTRVSVNQQQ